MTNKIKAKLSPQKKFRSIVKTPDNVKIRTREISESRLRDNVDVDAINLVNGAVPVYNEMRNIFELTNILDAQDVEGGEY